MAVTRKRRARLAVAALVALASCLTLAAAAQVWTDSTPHLLAFTLLAALLAYGLFAKWVADAATDPEAGRTVRILNWFRAAIAARPVAWPKS